MEYANAGHNLPILINENGNFELFKTTGPALGLIDNFKYTIQQIKVNSGDSILFYTDGITESMNNNGEQFGEGMLIKLLLKFSQYEVDNTIKQIINELNEFKSENFIQDDKTLMLFKRTSEKRDINAAKPY